MRLLVFLHFSCFRVYLIAGIILESGRKIWNLATSKFPYFFLIVFSIAKWSIRVLRGGFGWALAEIPDSLLVMDNGS